MDEKVTSNEQKVTSIEQKVTSKTFSLYLGHRIFGALSFLCIAGLENIYQSDHFLNQSIKILSQISGLRISCPSRKFGHETNLKGLLYY